jgi:sec-independent protein translocase protein TatC
MTLVEHLTELRYRLIKSLQGILVGVGIGLYFSEHLFTVIRKPILPYLGANSGLVFTGVLDKFIAHLKVGALAGLILTCPYWLYHVWQFVSPALYKKERKYMMAFIVSGSALFLLGVCFVYFLVFPAAFQYLLSIGGDVDKPMITIDAYLSFFTLMVVMFGLAFELPLILVILALLGLYDAEFLKKNRRIAIVILSVVAAVISPPDALSMIFMWVPLVFFYEASIWIVHFLLKNKPRPQI